MHARFDDRSFGKFVDSPIEKKWSLRKTALFLVLSCSLCWAAILVLAYIAFA